MTSLPPGSAEAAADVAGPARPLIVRVEWWSHGNVMPSTDGVYLANEADLAAFVRAVVDARLRDVAQAWRARMQYRDRTDGILVAEDILGALNDMLNLAAGGERLAAPARQDAQASAPAGWTGVTPASMAAQLDAVFDVLCGINYPAEAAVCRAGAMVIRDLAKAPASPAAPAPSGVARKPTIEELEAILRDNSGDTPIDILPDGSIRARDDYDQNVERLKACEHIADGDEGWEKLAQLCPSTAAVTRLRTALTEARAEVARLGVDARRYWRLRVLGCDMQGNHAQCFTNLDAFVDQDIKSVPSRGEAELSLTPPAPAAAREAENIADKMADAHGAGQEQAWADAIDMAARVIGMLHHLQLMQPHRGLSDRQRNMIEAKIRSLTPVTESLTVETPTEVDERNAARLSGSRAEGQS